MRWHIQDFFSGSRENKCPWNKREYWERCLFVLSRVWDKKFWVPLRNRTPDLRLSGRASECGIRRSEVRFLAGEFFLCPTLVTTKSVFFYFFTELKNFQSFLFYLEKRTLPQTNYQHAHRLLDLFWTQLKLALSRPRPSCSKGGWRHPTDKLLSSG